MIRSTTAALALALLALAPPSRVRADEVAPPERKAGAAAAPHTENRVMPKVPPQPVGQRAPHASEEQWAPTPPAQPPSVPAAPAPEVSALGKQLAGTWRCKGNAHRGDGSSAPLAATVTIKLDLGNAWIVTSLTEKTGPLRWTEYRTYDPGTRTWTRIQLNSASGYLTATSAGDQGGTWSWAGTALTRGSSLQVRDHEQWTGKSVKLWGEAQIGATWQALYDVTCKK